jgi:hypothetical protein
LTALARCAAGTNTASETPDPAANFFFENSSATPCELLQDGESIDEPSDG